MSDPADWERETDTHVFFWGGILSNWSKHSFVAAVAKDGPKNSFNCAEQYMMARKALLFNDIDALVKIMNSVSPSEQKSFGRQVKGFDANVWGPVAGDLFYPGLYAKFWQNWKIADKLLETGDKVIVEASPFDRIWGIGYDHLHAEESGADWGLNLLGKCLMRVRQDLRSNVDSSFEPFGLSWT